MGQQELLNQNQTELRHTHTHTRVSSLMEATVPCVAGGMQADMNDDRLLIEDT